MPVPVALETEAVAFAVALIGEGVAEAETKLKEEAAKMVAVDAKRMVSILAAFLLFLLLTEEPVAAVAGVNMKAAVGWWQIPAVAVDKARHDVGEDVEEEDGGCRNGPCTLVADDVAKEEHVVEDVDTEVDVIVLLLRARHDDDKSAERVAVHAAQDAMLIDECLQSAPTYRTKRLFFWRKI